MQGIATSVHLRKIIPNNYNSFQGNDGSRGGTTFAFEGVIVDPSVTYFGRAEYEPILESLGTTTMLCNYRIFHILPIA